MFLKELQLSSFFPPQRPKPSLLQHWNTPILYCSFHQTTAHIRSALINALHPCTKGWECLVDFHYYTLHSKCTFDGNTCSVPQKFSLTLSCRRQLLLTVFLCLLFNFLYFVVYWVSGGVDVEVLLPFLSRMWERGDVDDVCLSVSAFPLVFKQQSYVWSEVVVTNLQARTMTS